MFSVSGARCSRLSVIINLAWPFARLLTQQRWLLVVGNTCLFDRYFVAKNLLRFCASAVL